MIIRIKNLKLKTTIGIYAWEKNIQQEIIINARIKTNYEKALQSDNISDTIDYDLIVAKIKDVIASKSFNLIEGLIYAIMDDIMSDKRIANCKLELEKIMTNSEMKSCSITLEKDND